MTMELTELQEIAGLARIYISEEEWSGLYPAFEKKLRFFETMEEADIPTAQEEWRPVVESGFFRADITEQHNAELMLKQSPQRDGNFIVIPNVL